MRNINAKGLLVMTTEELAAYNAAIAQFQSDFDTVSAGEPMSFSADILKFGKPFLNAEGVDSAAILLSEDIESEFVDMEDAVPTTIVKPIAVLDVLAGNLGFASYRHMYLTCAGIGTNKGGILDIGTLRGFIKLCKAGDTYVKAGKHVPYKKTYFQDDKIEIEASTTLKRRISVGASKAVDAGFLAMLNSPAPIVRAANVDASEDEADL